MGRIAHLFQGDYLVPTLVGVTLASVGLATFWGAHIFGKDLLRRDIELRDIREVLTESQWSLTAEHIAQFREELKTAAVPNKTAGEQRLKADSHLENLQNFFQKSEGGPSSLSESDWRQLLDLLRNWGGLRQNSDFLKDFFKDRKDAVLDVLSLHSAAIKRWELLGMFLVTTGGGLGLLFFGPLCERIGRRGAFLFFHLGGLAISLACFQLCQGVGVLVAVLPIFGFLTLGMHAGYAIYFPELYPTRLRATGAGFCFNFGRILAAPILVISGKMQEKPKLNPNWWEKATNGFALDLPLEDTVSILSLLFLVGVVVLIFAPETKGKELPQ